MITRRGRDNECKASRGAHSWPRVERNMNNGYIQDRCVVSTTIEEKVKCSTSPNEEKFNFHMGLGGCMISQEGWLWS